MSKIDDAEDNSILRDQLLLDYSDFIEKQGNSVVSDEGIFAFMYQPASVYSNIRNAFGIFAGYNSTSVEVKVLTFDGNLYLSAFETL